MHRYLEAIGFSDIATGQQLEELLEETISKKTEEQLAIINKYYDLCGYYKEYGKRIGITVLRKEDMIEDSGWDYYFPSLEGRGITSYADVTVERKKDRQEFLGVCEDVRVGVSIIFYVQNPIEYIREKQLGNLKGKSISITLSALALEGTVLLPLHKDERQEKTRQEESRNRMMLLSAARKGDQSAIESLTLDDMDMYSRVSRRIQKEDIFTIVESYFMPYGLECDLYSILGEIREMEEVWNEKTEKKLYILRLNVNELVFDVCVPMEKVMGEPLPGRRFKAAVWLQGRINF